MCVTYYFYINMTQKKSRVISIRLYANARITHNINNFCGCHGSIVVIQTNPITRVQNI